MLANNPVGYLPNDMNIVAYARKMLLSSPLLLWDEDTLCLFGLLRFDISSVKSYMKDDLGALLHAKGF